jgi:thiol-disulfide isomerase/thioredoxin
MTMEGVALLAGRLLLAAIFGVAGFSKLASVARARDTLIAFGVPTLVATPITGALIASELAVAIALLQSTTAWYGAIGALVLLSIFSGAIAANLLRDRRPDCNCFGQLHSTPIGWPTFARSIALGTVAVVLIAYGHDAQPSASWTASLSAAAWLSLTGGVVVCALLVVIAGLLTQVLRQQGRMLLRFDGIEQRLGIDGPARASAQPRVGLTPGTPAPPFSVPDLDGVARNLGHLLNAKKPALLVFSNPACGPCQALMPEIAEWRRDLRDRLTIALITEESADANRKYGPIIGADLVLVQREREIATAYEAHGTPLAVAITANGRIASYVAQGAEAIRQLVQAIRAGELPVFPGSTAIAVGEAAPDFTLPTLAGGRIALGDLRGRPALLLFWNQHCGFCQRMLPELKAWEANESANAARLLVVSAGSIDDLAGLGLSATVSLDEGSSVAHAFGANGTPMAVLLDSEGRVASALAAGAHAFFALARRGLPSSDTVRTATTAGSLA